MTIAATPRALVIRACSLYPRHRSPVLEAHHIAPQSWWKAAGLPVNTPMASICGLCHNNAHACLDAIIRGMSTRWMPARCLELAEQGLDIARQRGLTPRPTL